MTIASILFAIFGLSFLIFIHELGHYFVAKWSGMKIEVFSIGMGKPMVSWKDKNKVQWQICYLLFGGYVKIAGMEAENGKEPHKISNGFYSKKPMYRLAVAAAGPAVNIVFAILVFAGIWFYGGQTKPFSQYTKVIGDVDQKSEVYHKGVRAGDILLSVNHKPYQGYRDIFFQGMVKDPENMEIVVDKLNGEVVKTTAAFYKPDHVMYSLKDFKTMGITAPGSYVIYSGEGDDKFNSLLKDAGIEKGDRIVWADGETIYSAAQLMDIVQRDVALVTVDREGQKIHVQVPRVMLGDLKLTEEQKDEFVDYKRDLDLEGAIASTYFIPYLVSEGLYVNEELAYIEEGEQKTNLLQKNDKILAVSGQKVITNEDFYKAIGERKSVIMVSNAKTENALWRNADKDFYRGLDFNAIALMENSIGSNELAQEGSFRFLTPISPLTNKEFYSGDEKKLQKVREILGQKSYAKWLEKSSLFANASLSDAKVIYNPNPIVMVKDLVDEFFFTLKNLFTGSISPKHVSGPVGMIKLVSDSSKSSIITGIYWLGMISLNLAFMNLLPIPMLDGGHICFTLYEMGTKRRIKAKTMQRLIFPFFALIVVFFIYITFHDILKFFS